MLVLLGIYRGGKTKDYLSFLFLKKKKKKPKITLMPNRHILGQQILLLNNSAFETSPRLP